MFALPIKAVLFDLDGTLLPVDQEYFLRKYFATLGEYLAASGFSADEVKKLIHGIWDATAAMLANDGERFNQEVFEEAFLQSIGALSTSGGRDTVKILEEFYFEKFSHLQEDGFFTPLAARIVETAHGDGRKVVLATNPVFPMAAQCERLRWIGLEQSDFDFVTSYENSSYCKPNPKYYLDICERIGVLPGECLMIGNDEGDDMKGASAAGLNCFLVTDFRIMAQGNFVWTGERGSFEQTIKLLERI